eukprot:TRINITY_DN4231_c0_g1_i1.p1 TRINITY_DN4231_c0_g1~~TRINITY_DN4231_c0_g1_i1.p1  ORF type:complete len:906 (-),score=211.38 TRINITY_DN4231_c0_g1_i1:291-3008(-)
MYERGSTVPSNGKRRKQLRSLPVRPRTISRPVTQGPNGASTTDLFSNTYAFDNTTKMSKTVTRKSRSCAQLPILTSTGHSAFDTITNGQRVLPIFRFQPVDVDKFRSEKQAEIKRQEEYEAMQAVGLDMSPAGAFSPLPSNSMTNSSFELPPISPSPQLAATTSTMTSFRSTMRNRGSIVSNQGSIFNSTTATGNMHDTVNLAATKFTTRSKSRGRRRNGKRIKKPLSTVEKLEKKLKKSRLAATAYTRNQVQTCLEIHRSCPQLSTDAIQKLVRDWGMQRFERVMHRLAAGKLGDAFLKWKTIAQKEALDEKMGNYRQYRSIQLFERRILEIQHGFKLRAMEKWKNMVSQQKQRERQKLEFDSACRIQRVARLWLARQWRTRQARMRAQLRLDNAATAIQRIARGWLGRRYAALIKFESNVIAIQRIVRGHLARQRVIRLRREIRQAKAATRFQSAVRMYLCKVRVRRIRDRIRKKLAAMRIQKLYRGILGRRRAAYFRRLLKEKNMSIRIQRIWRGFKGRKIAQRRRALLDARERRRNKAAVVIQSCFRQHRAYLAYQLLRSGKRVEYKKQDMASTRIQSWFRGYISRRRFHKLYMKSLHKFIIQARKSIEHWDVQRRQYFYYDPQTEQSEWEPPRTGYTRQDGMLVLATGKVIENPEIQLEDGEVACSECMEKIAKRHCVQCDDDLCDDCHARLHVFGKRKHHEWRPIGEIICVECETNIAHRVCQQCEDPYCIPCWDRIHARGHKQEHTWRLTEAGKSAQEQETAAQGYAGDYSGADAPGYQYDGAYAYPQQDNSLQEYSLEEYPTQGNNALANASLATDYTNDAYGVEYGGAQQYDQSNWQYDESTGQWYDPNQSAYGTDQYGYNTQQYDPNMSAMSYATENQHYYDTSQQQQQQQQGYY